MPERIALTVGINCYPGDPLRVCVHDAQQVAECLSMPEYGFAVSMLLDDQASRRLLMKQLGEFFRTDAGAYLFYFSGHGWATDTGVYLVTVDGDEVECGIELDYLRRLITNVAKPDATVVVILDCCHSGAATIRRTLQAGVDLRAQDVGRAIPSLPPGRVVLAACRGDQLAYEDPVVGYSVFTFHLLEGLLGQAADAGGDIAVPTLYDYLSRCLAEAGLQTPFFRGDIAGRLLLGRGFIPRDRPVFTEERAARLESEAAQHLQEYQARSAIWSSNLDQWKAEGFKSACQTLEPILRWFEHRVTGDSRLATRPTFVQLRREATSRLAALCSLDAGTVTTEGVATEWLGKGTFGQLWKVEPQIQGRPLAYKVYHAADLLVEDKVRRFRRGYQAMQQLDHPHIVKVHKFSDCPLGFYMDFIDGPNLRSFTGTIDEPQEILSILLTVAETLKHAHNRKVIHRDVKPENIVLSHEPSTGRWRPFLTDFDLAWFSTATQITTHEGLGTWQYSAPEQLMTPTSASAHAPSVDSYAFAQLCYFALLGSDPEPLGYEENPRRLEGRIRAGWLAQAATDFLGLYVDCTQRKAESRPDFQEICKRLARILQLLSDIGPSSLLPLDRFLRELVFSMVGISGQNVIGSNSFLTVSQKTLVSVDVRGEHLSAVDLTYDFQSQVPPVLEGVGTFEQLRRILNARVDSVLRGCSGVKWHHGKQSPFQVFADQNGVPLTLDGLGCARVVISRVVDAIEGK
jgi:hypothetical protein